MKNSLCLFFFLCLAVCNAQTDLSGVVKDAKSKEALPFCAIGVKHTTKGSLTNEDGLFRISAVLPADTLIVNFIGYKQKIIAVSDFVKNTSIYLEPKENVLAEVVVYSNDEYLYEALKKCRETLLRSKEMNAKAYFVLESELDKQPLELLECYYNAQFDNSGINNLNFKNGRVGLAAYDGRYFINRNTSKAISFLNLVIENKYLPTIPLQLDKRKLRKRFQLELKSVYDTLNPVYQITFKPRVADGKAFSGEVWIEKNTGNLKNIVLTVSETKHHPFIPMYEDYGQIDYVSIQVKKMYSNIDGENKPTHIDFNYQLSYRHLHNPSLLNPNKDTSFIVSCKGVVVFYDYNKLFYIPDFDLENELSDYRKITSLSYNDAFWTSNEGLMYSDKMKQSFYYFKKNGGLYNYKASNREWFRGHGFFSVTNITWSEKKRLSLKKDEIKNDTSSSNTSFRALAYKLKAQIFFDINKSGDSLQHYSCTVFDVFDSYYNLKAEPFTNCFLNIYFDLYEIERRNLEKLIRGKKYSVAQMDSIYKACNEHVKKQSETYLKEVERGKNTKALNQWNDYVKTQLAIDNIFLCGLSKN